MSVFSVASLALCCSVALVASLQLPRVAVNVSAGAREHAEVPAELQDIGLKIFGSKQKLDEFAANTAPPRDVMLGGFSMQFVTVKSEDIVKRFHVENKENNGDSYHFGDIKEKDGVLIDVGGNIGDTAILAAKIHPGMQVISFEPVPPIYFYMLWNLHLNGVQCISEEDLGKPGKPGVLAMDTVVGDGSDMTMRWNPDVLTCARDETSMDRPSHKPRTQQAVVHSTILPQFLSNHGVSSVRMFKLDCEGCEYYVVNLLKDMFADKSKIERVALEYHPGAVDDKKVETEFHKVLKERGCGEPEGCPWKSKPGCEGLFYHC